MSNKRFLSYWECFSHHNTFWDFMCLILLLLPPLAEVKCTTTLKRTLYELVPFVETRKVDFFILRVPNASVPRSNDANVRFSYYEKENVYFRCRVSILKFCKHVPGITFYVFIYLNKNYRLSRDFTWIITVTLVVRSEHPGPILLTSFSYIGMSHTCI